jgi:hypothetical protein
MTDHTFADVAAAFDHWQRQDRDDRLAGAVNRLMGLVRALGAEVPDGAERVEAIRVAAVLLTLEATAVGVRIGLRHDLP